MQVGKYYLSVEETHGSISQVYKCHIVDGLWTVGCGNSKREAMINCAATALSEAKKLVKDLEDVIEKEDAYATKRFSPEEFNELKDSYKWTYYKHPANKFVCLYCSEPAWPMRAVPFYGSAVYCGNCEEALTMRTSGGQSDPFNWRMV
jgi:hypothetical protein